MNASLLTMAMLHVVGPVNGHQGPWQGMKRRVVKPRIVLILLIVILIILVKMFIPQQLIRGWRYCSINNINELRLLMSSVFWVKNRREY